MPDTYMICYPDLLTDLLDGIESFLRSFEWLRWSKIPPIMEHEGSLNVHKSSPLNAVLVRINPFSILTPYLLKVEHKFPFTMAAWSKA
jgi:hypothetical protein